ncbi:MAG: NUDIX hydrolase, partial [Candidatus Saccharimonadales bacterium]
MSSSKKKSSIVFAGKIGEVVHTLQPDGRVFEKFCRPPGTRLVIVSPENKILITKELREETNNYDLRLPGGKVCDSLEEYNKLRENSHDILEAAKAGAIKEAREEAGIIVNDLEFITKATAGATVEWDLYYFLIKNYEEHPDGQALEHGEDIEITWMSIEEIKEAIKLGQMQEWRSA